jgi:PadR family transcriptional regulator
LKTAEIKLNILTTVKNSECYGYEIYKKLEAQDNAIEIGRLYKVLKEMLTEGTLSCRWEKSEKGPEKRVYKLTQKGREELDQILLGAIDTVHDYYTEYLSNLPPEISLFEDFAKTIIPKPKTRSKIVLYASRYSSMHERLLAALLDRAKESEVCLVRKELENNTSIRNSIFLQGDYDSIPLRAKYVDLLILEGLPSHKNSLKAVKEWQRILKEKGKLVVIVPTAVFSAFRDPLTIGDFMEKMEYQSLHEVNAEKGETLEQLLKTYFLNVKKTKTLQMTSLVAARPKPTF